MTSWLVDLQELFCDAGFKQVAVAVVALGLGLVLLKKYCGGPMCPSSARLDNKTVLITGGNRGLGRVTAIEIAKRGARVLIACRDTATGRQVAQEIARITGSEDTGVYELDLSSQKSVRACAKNVIENEARLDILINNAGVMWIPKQTSADGHEMTLAVNHLGHFLLTNLLLDKIKATGSGRIVTLSSCLHRYTFYCIGAVTLDLGDLNMEKHYDKCKAYSHSKVCNVLFTLELARRLQGSGVTANCLHPGVCYTDLFLSQYPRWVRLLLAPSNFLALKTPLQGSQTTLYCAVAEELEGVSGKYFSDCAEGSPSKYSQDGDIARQLWEISEDMTCLKDPSNVSVANGKS